jgi:hypothetical protein
MSKAISRSRTDQQINVFMYSIQRQNTAEVQKARVYRTLADVRLKQ